MFDGYIKLYRTSLDSKVFQNEVAWKIWTWCLLKATHQEFTVMIGRQIIELSPGQFIFGGIKASEELGFAISTIWYWLTFFEKNHQAELKKTNKFTVITILNWRMYQTSELKKNSKRIQKETYKNIKNGKNTDNTLAVEAEASPQSTSSTKEKEASKEKKINVIYSLLEWAEKHRSSKFANKGKQLKAISNMKKAGLTPKEIINRWEEMENDSFWEKKGFDFTNIANSFDKRRN